MNSAAPVTPQHIFNQPPEFAGGFERTPPPGLDDGPRDAPGRVLLAVFIDDPRELGLGLLVDDVVGAQLLPAIHPHVQRPVETETETTVGVVKRETAQP